ncbi:putative ankyrin repeat protein [Botrytis fragariae]|uniref:Putative ankyrin repeat protein n=1 Tax=Botrytis fragariae TaxID=1964551 RepID=A0A8H6AZA2_9HELO|nr:putative ankyrin repeat protein [Botrytis fragariae]KAF5876175.1 putative ankyrin repeat protein [Botrytis fragariae]
MEIRGGTDWHRDSEISMVQLRLPKTSPSTRTSIGDNEVQSQNFVPHSSAETSQSEPARLNGRPKSEIDELPFKGSPSLGQNPRTTEVDIIGVPAIGGDPEITWMSEAKFTQDGLFPLDNDSEVKSAFMRMTPVSPAYSIKNFHKRKPAWIVRDIRSHKDLSMARVLLYGHGYPKDGDTLKQLATLTDARRRGDPILHDCYGVTFFATPHRGSSYLSQPGFSGSIRTIMGLSRELPISITRQLELDHDSLKQIGKDFKALATELKVWTFFETIDSNITGPDQGKPFHAPITSIKSAILNLRNESVYPLVSTHTKCAAFGSTNGHTKEAYLAALAAVVKQACKLSKLTHFELNLERRVEVEINGFYEGSATIPTNEPPIRVWSTNRSLHDFRRAGPTQLLKERREEVSAAPGAGQYLRHNTRAPYLPIDKITSDAKIKGHALIPKSTSKLNPFKRSSSPSPQTRRVPKVKAKGSPDMTESRKTGSVPSPPALIMTSDVDDIAGIVPEEVGVPTKLRDPSPTAQLSSSDPDVANSTSRISFKQHKTSLDHELSIAQGSQPSIRKSRTENEENSTRPGPFRRHSESLAVQSSFLSPSRADLHQDKSSSSAGREESGIVLTPSVPPLLDPSFSKLKLTWIHVPFNNPTWVPDVLERISNEKGPDVHSKMLDHEHWHSKQVRGRHQEHHHACFLKPHCSFFGLESVSPLASPKIGIGSVDMNHVQMCLYLPYLHFDTYKVLVKRRAFVKQRIEQGRSRPVPQQVSKLDSQEIQVLWQYLGHDPPINARRTLDQFGYPSLLDTRARDDDQMLYKMTKERHTKSNGTTNNTTDGQNNVARMRRTAQGNDKEDAVDENSDDSDNPSDSDTMSDDDVLDGNVLMVDQLWLWVIDGSVVTFFSSRAGLKTDGRLFQQADLRDSIFNEVNADLTSRCENSYDLAALVALHAVTILFERTSHPNLEVFRIFEEAISILTEKMTTSFKDFRARGFRAKADDNDDLRTSSIRAKHALEGKIAEEQNRENTSALLELRDIEDELNTLKTLFNGQMTEIRIMLDVYEKRKLTTNGLVFLRNAEEYLEEYTQHVEKMMENAKNTRDDFDKLLGMIQRQAQVDEVRLARYQADLASAQSRSVMIFTVFTVIFLPLSFFTGLFGMNVREWGGGDYLPLRTVGVIAIPTSSALITLALIIAWSIRIRHLFNYIGKKLSHIYTSIHEHVNKAIEGILETEKDFGRRSKLKGLRQRKKKRKLEKEQTRLHDEDWDFWESHKERREKDYKIPNKNRKSGLSAESGIE